MICVCDRPHYPLRFFKKGTAVLATRGTKPVENVLGDGWVEFDASEGERRLLSDVYSRSHQFDWLHTPTYLDDKEAHFRMKAQTARIL